MNFIFYDNKIIPASEPVFLAANRGYRYGDGLFETMKLVNGNILLGDYHFNRLMAGIALLQMEV
ncbi:MAG: aminotransferase class IV, partial [Flavitalea sp.]